MRGVSDDLDACFCDPRPTFAAWAHEGARNRGARADGKRVSRAGEAQARQALAQYQQTILVAFKEVEDALVAVRTAREQSQAQEAQVVALRSALHLADLRYKGGISNYLDVLTARRSLFDAELALTATRRLHLVSIVQLYKALGGGWSPSGG